MAAKLELKERLVSAVGDLLIMSGAIEDGNEKNLKNAFIICGNETSCQRHGRYFAVILFL